MKKILLSFLSVATTFVGFSQLSKSELNALAVERYNENDLQGAIHYFSEVIKYFPNDSIAYFDRGMMKEYAFDFDGAIDDFTKQITVDSNAIDSYFLRGIIQDKLGNDVEANKDYTKVIELESGNADAHYFRGLNKVEAKDIDGALIDFSNAFKANPNHERSYTEKAILLIKQKKYKEASLNIDKAISSDSTFAKAYYFRGWLKAEKRDFKGAIDDYLKAISINPEFELEYLFTPKMKHKLSDYDKALKQLNNENPNKVSYLELGMLNLYLNHIDEASNFLDKNVKMYVKNTFTFYQIARLKQAQENKIAALDFYQKAIELDATNPFYYLKRAEYKLRINENACEDFSKYKKLSKHVENFSWVKHCK